MDQLEQLVASLGVALLLRHVHQLDDPLQALALPVGALADLQHHAARIALVGFEHIGQLGRFVASLDFGPEGHKAMVGMAGAELAAGQQFELATDGVVGRAQLALQGRIVEPVVGVERHQCASFWPFQGLGARAVIGPHFTGGLVVAPLHLSVSDKGIGMTRHQGQAGRVGIWQGSSGHIALACRQTGGPLAGASGLPTHARGAEHGIALRTRDDQQLAGVSGGHLGGGAAGQGQAHVTPAQAHLHIRAAVGHGGGELVRPFGHGNVYGPVAGAGQLGLLRRKGQGAEAQRLGMGVMNLGVFALGGHHHLAWVGHF